MLMERRRRERGEMRAEGEGTADATAQLCPGPRARGDRRAKGLCRLSASLLRSSSVLRNQSVSPSNVFASSHFPA